MGKIKTTLVVLSYTLACVILTLIVAMSLAVRKYKTVMDAVGSVLHNEIFCRPQEGPCELMVVDELFQPVKVSKVFDYDTARFCADLVARVSLLFYKKRGLPGLKMPPDLFVRRQLYFNDEIIGFVASSSRSDIVWIAFRGTAVEEEWRQDFNFSQVSLDWSHENQEKFQLWTGETLSCHVGFLNVFEQFKLDLVSVVGELCPGSVVVTGHSLGASLATLAAMRLSQFDFPVYNYSFGSPRICDCIPPVLDGYWRINNTSDVIPHIPLSVMPRIHSPLQPYLYQHGGTAVEFSENRRSLGHNHLMPVYIHALDNRTCLVAAVDPLG